MRVRRVDVGTVRCTVRLSTFDDCVGAICSDGEVAVRNPASPERDSAWYPACRCSAHVGGTSPTASEYIVHCIVVHIAWVGHFTIFSFDNYDGISCHVQTDSQRLALRDVGTTREDGVVAGEVHLDAVCEIRDKKAQKSPLWPRFRQRGFGGCTGRSKAREFGQTTEVELTRSSLFFTVYPCFHCSPSVFQA
jgi:hypothetical protein